MHVFNFNVPGSYEIIAKKLLEIEERCVEYNTGFCNINMRPDHGYIHIFIANPNDADKCTIDFVNNVAPIMEKMQMLKSSSYDAMSSLSHSVIERQFVHPSFISNNQSISMRRLFITSESVYPNAEFVWCIVCTYTVSNKYCLHGYLEDRTRVIIDMTNTILEPYYNIDSIHNASVFTAIMGMQKNIINMRVVLNPDNIGSVFPCTTFVLSKKVMDSKSIRISPAIISHVTFKRVAGDISNMMIGNYSVEDTNDAICQSCHTQLIDGYACGIMLTESDTVAICLSCTRLRLIVDIINRTKLPIHNIKCMRRIDDFARDAGLTMQTYNTIDNVCQTIYRTGFHIDDSLVVMKNNTRLESARIAEILELIRKSRNSEFNIAIVDTF